jgi:O-antigen ligase/tetratricopeptide (TPR) repeat protein
VRLDEGRLRAEATAWVLVGCVFAGLVLFGATRIPVGELRLDAWLPFAGLILIVSGLTLALQPPERRPGAGWIALVLAFPAWLLLQQVPLPAGWVGALDPGKLRMLSEVWAGPVSGCEGSVLLAGDPGSWNTLTLDPTSTRDLMFRVLAAGMAFLAARAAFGGRPSRRGALLFAVALFAGAEGAYGVFQWITGAGKILWMEKTAYLDSATGTLINRNHFAMLLYLGLGCSLSLLVRDSHEAEGRGRGDPSLAERWLASRATLALLVGLQLAGIVASKSRAGLLAGLLVLLPCVPALLKGNRTVRLVAWLVLALVAVPAVLIAGPPLVERLSELPREWTSDGGRGAVFRLMGGLATELPVFGVGGGAFEWLFLLHRPQEIVGRYDFAHNDYLQVLVETGFVGLLLLLLPVAAFFAESLRRRRSEHPQERNDWPLLLALGAVALHELVDFGLQLPAPMIFAAVLAGAAARPPRRGARGSGLAVPAGALAVLTAVPALLFGLATWPGLESPLAAFHGPDAHHSKARELARAARSGPGDRLPPEAACRAIEIQARAQAARPLSAYYAVSQASYTLAALRAGGFSEEMASGAAREQAARQIDAARRLDRWRPLVRERLMMLSLSMGALDQAMEDARIAGRESGFRAERVVDKLESAGLPLSLFGRELAGEPQLLEEIVARAMRSGTEAGRRLAAELVPEDATADERLCSVGWRIAATIRTIHGKSAMPFLEGCLEIASRPGYDKLRPEAVKIWMGADHEHFERYAAAAAMVEDLPPSRGRCNVQLGALRRLGRWEALTSAARECLDEDDVDPSSRQRARWYAWLGEAYARRDRQSLAIRAYEHAVAYAPGHGRYRRDLAALERGENPFAD